MDASGDTLSVLTLVRVLKYTRRGSQLNISNYSTRKAPRDSGIVCKLNYYSGRKAPSHKMQMALFFSSLMHRRPKRWGFGG